MKMRILKKFTVLLMISALLLPVLPTAAFAEQIQPIQASEAFSPRANETIEDLFPDPGMQQMVAAGFGLSITDVLSSAQLSGYTILGQDLVTGTKIPINSLEGIEKFTGLAALRIDTGHLTNLDALANCLDLWTIKMPGLGIENIDGLANLPMLLDIDLSHNLIEDITPIKDQSMLRTLIVADNKIQSLPDLNSLCILPPYMFTLDISNNPLTNIDALNTMNTGYIEHLNISGLSLSSPADFATLTAKAQQLTAGDNEITNINVFSNVIGLESLSLPNNKISEITAGDLTGFSLNSLSLQGNQLIDVSGLEGYFGTLDPEYTLEATNQLYQIDQGYAKDITLPVDLVGFNGAEIEILTISNSGTYDSVSNSIVWGNIDPAAQYVEYTFQSVMEKEPFGGEIPGEPLDKLTYFSGTVRIQFPAIEAVTYSVIYDGNGADAGVVPVDNTAYELDDDVTVLGNIGMLAKTNTFFDGWDTQANGEGSRFAAADIFLIQADTVLYAQWTTGSKPEPKEPGILDPKEPGTGTLDKTSLPKTGSSHFIWSSVMLILGFSIIGFIGMKNGRNNKEKEQGTLNAIE